MKEITDINECHEILLGIAKQFAGICDRHNIDYYMLGGTMLGAIRHKGFIPWDDDMDFGVMREDFPKLLFFLDKELKYPYKLHTYRDTVNILGQTVKIADERTVTNELLQEGFTPMGINIDIFPLDYAKSDGRRIDRPFISNIIKRIYSYKYWSLRSRPFLKKIAAALIKLCLCWMSKDMFVKLTTKLDKSDCGDYIANNSGAWGLKETVPKTIFKTSHLYQFEDTKFIGVADYDSYLSHLYGNYMQLPPEEKRHIHLSSMYWK